MLAAHIAIQRDYKFVCYESPSFTIDTSKPSRTLAQASNQTRQKQHASSYPNSRVLSFFVFVVIDFCTPTHFGASVPCVFRSNSHASHHKQENANYSQSLQRHQCSTSLRCENDVHFTDRRLPFGDDDWPGRSFSHLSTRSAESANTT